MRNTVGARTGRTTLAGAIAAVATSSLVAAGMLVASPALAAPAPAGLQPTGLSGQTAFEDGRYVVTLADDPVATYKGDVDGFESTTPEGDAQLNTRSAPVQDYSEYLAEQQVEVADEVGADIAYSYTVTLNGFAAQLTAEQAAKLSADKRVAALELDEIKPLAATPSTDFLGLSGDGGVWDAVGGAESAGDGVVVGVIDTGIAPENPSFAGEPLGTEPGSAPYLDGDTITYAKNDGGTFTSVCQPGEAGQQFDGSECSTKIVGAQYWVDGFGSDSLGLEVGEYISPRDGDGHGSHTASTAAGNHEVEATAVGRDFGKISGVAPGAKVSSYKACWSGPDPAVTTDDGCASSDLLAAIDQAVTDGVDVINYSIGGGAAQTTVSATDIAFLNAAAAGIFVSASAGNSGPTATTLDNASPWITTVAASTIPSYEATATFSDADDATEDQAFAGASITVTEPVTAPATYAGAVGLEGATNPQLCLADTLDPELVAGTIVVCERGENARVDKSAEVKRAGGVGTVLVNPTPASVDLDTHTVPTVHLDAQFYEAAVELAQVEGATITLTEGNETGITPPTPQLAGFSSRGPVEADGSDILKPDVAAPGVAILAATANPEDGDPTWAFLSGTSMAAPHVAGLAALYLGERPNATPAEIKSALMTTAYDTVDPAGDPYTDPFGQGAGHVDPTRFFEPGLLYLNGETDWDAYINGLGYDWAPGVDPIDASNLNLASISIGELTAPETITREVTVTTAGTYEAQVSGVPGVDVTVEPSSFTAAEGDTVSFEVTFARTDAPLDEFSTGSLTWSSSATTVRSPLAVRPVTIVAPDNVSGEGTTGSVDVEVTPGGTGDIPLSTTGLSKGETTRGSGNPGQTLEYPVTVAEGAQFARFDLLAVDKTVDLDLVVYLLDEAGEPVAGWQSATGSSDERVDLVDPEAGEYLVLVAVYSGAPGTEFDLTTTSVVDGGAELALDPAVLAGVQGEKTSYTASWAGLDETSSYLGLVSYGDTGASTVVTVTTGEDEEPEPTAPVNVTPPTVEGTAKVGSTLTATPGEWDSAELEFAYQWQRDGVDIDGATAATYKVAKADQGAALSVVVTATNADGVSASAASEAVTVKWSSTTKLSLNRSVGFSWQKVTATVRVDSPAEAAPTGTVTLRIDGKDHVVPAELDASGKLTYQLPKLRSGIHTVKATYAGDDLTTGSTSSTKLIWIIF
ncbi:MAG: S8 family serine peptidase [Microbacteriaceae bacterium]